MSWDEYADIVEAEWQQVLNDPNGTEAKVHSFLEDHPCLIPGYDAFNASARREGLPPGPIYEAVFSKPRLMPGRDSYVPDFMWLPTDSLTQWAVLIEIENPLKPWFRKDGQQTQYFTQAIGQLADWVHTLEGDPENVQAFAKKYGIRRRLSFNYCLIFGRRSDAMNSARGTMRHIGFRDSAFKLMTFDRLRPAEPARNALCIKASRNRYTAISAPPTLRLETNLPQMWHPVAGKEEAVARSPHFTDERRAYLIERLRYWDGRIRGGGSGSVQGRE